MPGQPKGEAQAIYPGRARAHARPTDQAAPELDQPFGTKAVGPRPPAQIRAGGAPAPWVIIYTVRDPETVIITYLRHARSRWESR